MQIRLFMYYTTGYFSQLVISLFAFSAIGSMRPSTRISEEQNSIIKPYMAFLSSETMLASDIKLPTKLINQVPLLKPQDQFFLGVNIIQEYEAMVFCDPVTDRDLSTVLLDNTNFDHAPSIATIRKNQTTINQMALATFGKFSDSVKQSIFNWYDSLEDFKYNCALQDSVLSWGTDWAINEKPENCGFRPAATLVALLSTIGPISSKFLENFPTFDTTSKSPVIIPSILDTAPFGNRFEAMRKAPFLKGKACYVWETGLNEPIKLAGKWKANVPVLCIDFDQKKFYPVTTKSSFLYYENGPEEQPTILTVIKPDVIVKGVSVALFEDSCTITFPQGKTIDPEFMIEFWKDQNWEFDSLNGTYTRWPGYVTSTRCVFFDILKNKNKSILINHYLALISCIDGSDWSEIHIYQLTAQGKQEVQIIDCERI